MQFHGASQRCSSTARHNGDVLRCDPTPHLRQHFNPISSPESAARHAWVTLPSIFVTRECSTTLLGNTVAHFRRPKVRHDTFRRHFRPFLLPVGVGQNDVRIRGTLRQRNPYTFRRPRVKYGTLGQHCRAFSSPEGAVRHFQATLQRLFVARECGTARLGDTSVHFCCPWV